MSPKFDEWIREDLGYVDNWSLTLDLKILAHLAARLGAFRPRARSPPAPL